MMSVDNEVGSSQEKSTRHNALVEEDENGVCCSDEELYDCSWGRGGQWHPPPSEIVKLYNLINEKGIVELDWQNPGRRSPSPPTETVDSRFDKVTVEEEDKPPTEFDFDDLFTEGVTAKITPRRTPGNAKLKGSGQKRVASFKNVMFDIRRQMRLEQLDKTPSKSQAMTKKASNSKTTADGNMGSATQVQQSNAKEK